MSIATHWPVFGACLGACAACVTDLRTRRIPNGLTLGLLAAALLGHTLLGSLLGLWHALVGALVCGVVPTFLFFRGALGGGDVKLFAALGALVGVGPGLEIQLAAFALLTVFALVYVAWKGALVALLRSSLRASLHLLSPARFPLDPQAVVHTELPMGLAILTAVLAVGLREVLL